MTCLCGCGETAGRGSSYRPGHDARHASRIGRAMAAAGAEAPTLLAELPSDALRAKALKMLTTSPRPARSRPAGARPPTATAPKRIPDSVQPHGVGLDGLTTRQLLRLYADLLTELISPDPPLILLSGTGGSGDCRAAPFIGVRRAEVAGLPASPRS